MTVRAATNTGINAAVSYKWLLSILGPVILAVSGAVVWMVNLSVAPVKQQSDNNEKRIERQEERIEKRLDRIEEKVDELLKR